MTQLLSMFDTHFMQKLSLHARHAFKEARDIARYTKSSQLETRHLLLALALEHGSLGATLLDHMGFQKEAVGKLCLRKPGPVRSRGSQMSPPLSSEVKDIMKRAFYIASHCHYPYVGTEHLVSAMFEVESHDLDDIIAALHIDEQKIEHVLEAHLNFEQFPQLARLFDMTETSFPPGRNKTEREGSFLEHYGVDVAKDAEERGDVLVGRTKELERLMQILGRKQKHNAILIGEPGVGKTALVAALAQKIERGEAGPVLTGKKIVALDLSLLVAGTSFRGEFEARVKELLREVKENRHIILFIDEIHTLIGTGNTQGGLDAANILKPALARGEIQCIGATTLAEYKRHFEKDAALERRFQPIFITEPNASEARTILQRLRPAYERHHSLIIRDEAVDTAVTLAIRYLPERFLPDKAIDLLDEAASLVRRREIQDTSFLEVLGLEKKRAALLEQKDSLLAEERYDEAAALQREAATLQRTIQSRIGQPGHTKTQGKQKAAVTARDILTVTAQMTGIPFAKLEADLPEQRLARIQSAFERRIVGQESVLQHLHKTLLRCVAGINDPQRPLGSFLFLGPTGVGKTHVAKVLAEEFFGDAKALVRLDMSEFMERHSVAQILGAPAGYVGYGEGGKLTEQVRRKPYSVILFDEIEKAHPDVGNILLQILDEGTLTDAEGRRVSFRNAIVILTSNVGTESFTQSANIGFAGSLTAEDLLTRFAGIKEQVLGDLKRSFRPELMARLDAISVFQALDQGAIEKIVRLELASLEERLKSERVSVRFMPPLIRWLTERSFAPEQGGRLVRKNIQDYIEHAIAEKLLSHKPPLALVVTVKGDQIVCR